MAEKVTLPAELREKLAGANGDAVPLHDEAGNVVGYYLSAAEMDRRDRKRRELLATWSDEDIARLEEERKNDPRPDVPHEEVMRWIREQ